MNKRIAIIGLGWVGQPLARQLVEKGHTVCGTTQTKEKKQLLRDQNFETTILSLAGEATDFSALNLDTFDTMIIAITPGFKRGATDYPYNVDALIAYAGKKNIKQVILLSSTGVYTGLTGIVTERSKLELSIDKVSLLHRAEQAVLNYSGQHQVLRLAGLVGPCRLPGKFLSGKKNVADPYGAINLIHQQDVLNIICRFIEEPEREGIYNCVSPTLSTRKQFYTQAAKAMSLEPPIFVEEFEVTEQRRVCAHKLKVNLSYTFDYSDLLGWIKCMYT
jgi:nucleoside-diphosphate-sugar epimerase